MWKILYKALFLLLVISMFASCSSYNKLVKSTDMEKKYYMAKEYYNKGDCMKALGLLEELVQVYKNTAKAESIYYYYCYANYCTEDYIVAAYHFKNFSRVYQHSGFAEECLFMGALCFSKESPRYSLDQSDTKSAIKEMQLFINKYPNSKRVDSCNTIIDKLRAKLEKKSFEIAKQYYNIEDYKGAMIAFQNLIKDYPDTKYREEALFMHLKASYKYAYNSIETKKLPRLDNTIEYYHKFIALFPQSKYLNEAEDIYNDAQQMRSKLAYEVPRSLLEKGLYASCIELSGLSLSAFPNHPKRQDVAFILLQATMSLADITAGYDKESKLKSVISVYNFTKPLLTDEHFTGSASKIAANAQAQLENLPYTLPAWFYESGDMGNAYASAKKTLEKFPDHPKKEKLAYILLRSGDELAFNEWQDRKGRLEMALKDHGVYGGMVSKKKSVLLKNCINAV
jgi:outer membrane protein assembly factor BamD